MRKLTTILAVVLLSACATVDRPDSSNLAAYCTADNAYRLGTQGKAYFGVCPKDTEGAFLAGLQRGRELVPKPPQALPYFTQMSELEKQLAIAGSDAERERIRARLRDAEFWAIHILNNPGSNMN